MGGFALVPARYSTFGGHFPLGDGPVDSVDGTAGLSIVALETRRCDDHDRDPWIHGHRDAMALDARIKGLSTRQARAVP